MSDYRLYDQDEDAASRALAALMVAEPTVLRAVIRLIAPVASGLKTPWKISPQHRTFSGRRIDIFVRNGDFSIVVEAKIRDGIKAFQFDHYVRHVMEHETGRCPTLVWLVQKRRAVIGLNASKARQITWNDLFEALNGLESAAVQIFCVDLVSCRIVLPVITGPRRKTHKGYDPDYAVAILRRVRDTVGGLEGDVEENTRTPLSLHVGRKEWRLHWNTRVWFYFQPLIHSKSNVDAYKFVCHLLLYNSEHDLFEPSRIEKWSVIMAQEGLILKRNYPGKWKGSGDELSAPLRLLSKTGLRYVFGDPVETVCQRFVFDWRNEEEAIKIGHRYLTWGLGVIDQCLKR